MVWRVVEHTTIYREAGWYGAHPNVVRTPRGDLLALMQPINDHLGQAHTLERIQELTNEIDMARKRMARLAFSSTSHFR